MYQIPRPISISDLSLLIAFIDLLSSGSFKNEWPHNENLINGSYQMRRKFQHLCTYIEIFIFQLTQRKQ